VNGDAGQVRRKIRVWYLAGLLISVGIAVFYAIFALPNAGDYPYVRMASAAFSVFAILSGLGIILRKTWVRWALLLLLMSMYAVFATTHAATGNTPQVVSLVAFVLLPFAAFFFWRVVKKFVFEDS
jgi:hypothetical protein